MSKQHSRTEVLKEYYGQYLTEIRGLSTSSVKHYYDALNNISRRLKDKGLIKKDIYEIMDLEYLKEVREILYADPVFIELNERGRRMYSSGLNNYYRFATGEEFQEIKEQVVKLDIPLTAEEPEIITQKVWKRSNILRVQALMFADFKCEIESSHKSFIAEKTQKPYMEGHHAIPMRLQTNFDNSLDVYANIVCLCPICHRRIHYGLLNDRVAMLRRIYKSRGERLATSGIKVSCDEFIDLATGN